MTVQSLISAQPAPVSVLTSADHDAAAKLLGCEARTIRAFASVETGTRGPFDSQGRPTILFERHLFHRATSGKFDEIAPSVSNATPGGYGPYSAQYSRLARAAALDGQAALSSASWGAFQVLGMYHDLAGFASVEEFVQAMRSGVAAHLQAFASFAAHNGPLRRALAAKDWTAAAIAYNGRGEAEHRYDEQLAAAYLRDA